MEAAEADDARSVTQRIGQELRRLRLHRGWTQEVLAERLGLSQATLSRVEQGRGSLTAEQFLHVLRLFNVDVDVFVPTHQDAGLQNALARFGAAHLREHPDAGVPASLATARDAVRAVLLEPRSERWVTSLAPVLVASVDALPLAALLHDLNAAGVPNRLGWLVENTSAALAHLPATGTRNQARAARAKVVLADFLARVSPREDSSEALLDMFDPGVRSEQSLAHTLEQASAISRRWRIGTTLTPADFLSALEASFDNDP